MCRSIKQLRRPAEPPTEAEISAAALQYIRKVSGFRAPSRANQADFDKAVAEVAQEGAVMAAKKAASPKAPAGSAGIGDEAVLAKTGRRKDEWFAILDKAGAARMTHPEIVAVLSEEHGVAPWWRQMLAVVYEQARGLREPNQATSGFQMSASKTVAAPVTKLYKAFATTRSRERWLPEAGLSVRKTLVNRRIRYDGPNSSFVEAAFTDKGDDKSAVTVTVMKLADKKAMESQKVYWKQALDRLKEQVER
jgi:uncharacterized protein YndB with AHSA1/START domain